MTNNLHAFLHSILFNDIIEAREKLHLAYPDYKMISVDKTGHTVIEDQHGNIVAEIDGGAGQF